MQNDIRLFSNSTGKLIDIKVYWPALAGSNSKRYFKIDQHLALHFEYYGACLSTAPLPFCAV